MSSETPKRDPAASLAMRTPGSPAAQTTAVVESDLTDVRRPVPLTFGASWSDNGLAAPSTLAPTSEAVAAPPSADQPNGMIGESVDATDDDQQEQVTAYARLDFESFTFYVQTMQVVLGRRPDNGGSVVDVHLGPSKAISRKHARIFYNFATQRFEIAVTGRNGAFVGDAFVEQGSTVPLKDNIRVQIGQITFTFVLPPSEAKAEEAREAEAKLSEAEVEEDSNNPESARAKQAKKKKKKVAVKSGDEKNFFAQQKHASPDSGTGDGDGGANGDMGSPSVAPKRKPKREYKPEEIPPEHREKPAHSYSHLIASALRDRAPEGGLSLADIYEAIMDLFPYYRYCPAGWQNSVRHNLSSSKSFRKVSKEGKGWLWGLDKEYIMEKERQKQLQQQRAAAAAAAKEQMPSNSTGVHQRASGLGAGSEKAVGGLSQETVRLLSNLQQQVQQQLVKAGLPQINPQLLSNALAIVVAQAAKQSGGLANLANLLREPTQVRRLLVQALELLKKSNPKATTPSLGNAPLKTETVLPPVPSQAAPVPTPTILTADTENSVHSTSQPNHVSHTEPIQVAQATANEANRAEAPNEAQTNQTNQTQHGSLPAQPVPSVQSAQPAQPVQSVQPSQSVQSVPSSQSVQSVQSVQHTQPAQPAQPVKTEVPAPSSTPEAVGETQGQQSQTQTQQTAPGAKKPLTRERLAELLAQAEKIPNPTPQIEAMIKQLRAHQRNMEQQAAAAAGVKRPAEVSSEDGAETKRPTN